jgi:8-oxo-dGTP pyrophosphatase MutT (NUDIX family)
MEQTEDCFHLGVKTLIRNNAGKLLLLERQHRSKGVYWDIPGGRLQKGESLLETLRRELEEETGLKNIEGAFPFTMMVTNIRIPIQGNDVGLILSIYRYDINSTFTPCLSAEHTSFGWFSASEAAELLKNQYPSEFIESLAKLT